MRNAPLLLACLAIAVASVAPGAAQDADPTRYAVTYVDVVPSSASRAVDAFRRYRDASARETGFVKAQLLEQSDRPGRFVILETWKDQPSFDAHQGSGATTQFRSALDPVRLSTYDQRPYKTLTVGSSAGGVPRDSVVVVAHVDIGGGTSLDVPAAFRRFADATRKERGSLRFEVLQHVMRANHFTVVEVWESARALDAHAAAPHTKQYRDEVQPATGSPLDERLYKVIEG
jgi:quinol monooxygenase YgiN